MVEDHLLFFLLCCCVKDSLKQECLTAKWNSSIKIQLHQNCYQTLRKEAAVADGGSRGEREKLCSFNNKTSGPISDVSGKKNKYLFRRTCILFFFKLVTWNLQSESDDSFILLIFLSRAILVRQFFVFIMVKLYITSWSWQLLLWITSLSLKDHQQTCNCTKQGLIPTIKPIGHSKA